MIHCLTSIQGLHILSKTSFLLFTPASPPSKAFFSPSCNEVALFDLLTLKKSITVLRDDGEMQDKGKMAFKSISLKK